VFSGAVLPGDREPAPVDRLRRAARVERYLNGHLEAGGGTVPGFMDPALLRARVGSG